MAGYVSGINILSTQYEVWAKQRRADITHYDISANTGPLSSSFQQDSASASSTADLLYAQVRSKVFLDDGLDAYAGATVVFSPATTNLSLEYDASLESPTVWNYTKIILTDETTNHVLLDESYDIVAQLQYGNHRTFSFDCYPSHQYSLYLAAWGEAWDDYQGASIDINLTPEPATFALLALATTALRRKRRYY